MISEILKKHGSDKVHLHAYGQVYDKWLPKYKDSATHILEIGILAGCSMRAWHEYFENAEIHGIDNEAHRLIQGERFRSHHIDTKERDKFIEMANYLPDFDVIIDDGSHVIEEQTFAAAALWHRLKTGGIYVIEDIYRPQYLFALSSWGIANVYDFSAQTGIADDRIVVLEKA